MTESTHPLALVTGASAGIGMAYAEHWHATAGILSSPAAAGIDLTSFRRGSKRSIT